MSTWQASCALSLCYVLFSSHPTLSDESDSHQTTVLPDHSRYAFVQSTLAARLTFKLDRINGNVYQLVETREKELAWQEMFILNKAITPYDTPSWILFTSKLTVKYTFLMDTISGDTWVLQEDDNSDLYWHPFVN